MTQSVAQEITFKKDAKHTIPRLAEAQVVVIPLIREAIAPLLVRNNDADDVTDLVLAGKNRILMIASKTKGVERRVGSRILRALTNAEGQSLGGRYPANKTMLSADNVRDAYDLNTFVFGDSAKDAKGDKAIYSVHAAVLYSDAMSIQPRAKSIYEQFRHGGIAEDGGSFDAENSGASSNIFTTRYVKPGTLFVQSLVIPGNRLTRAALDHLLLAIGSAGAYGGQTAITGTNLRTHACGIYWGRLEREINAPLRMLEQVDDDTAAPKVETVRDRLAAAFANAYPHGCAPTDLDGYILELMQAFEQDDADLLDRYRTASIQLADLYQGWFFGGEKTPKGKGKAKAKTPAPADEG
ncbi:type I-D CRISPR-associated protein Cas7/Csc2 [Thiocystis violacea]|uniref:type I-D CRISPR-associated protein Cas7/Csc2 n=1 Tax=Thiocystis violacea TaxID=13725 RepID=UPI00190326D6|nr:type I-D CRISPR-associated protein Cas7/Csc2 [Thiocystis violacea]